MATPWQGATVKHLKGIGHQTLPLPAGTVVPAFSAPAHQKDIKFDAAQLKGSMAVAMMLSSASAPRLASAAAPIASFLADFVDDSVPPDELKMVTDVEKLSDVGRTLLPSLFGTAIADQYMLALGYRYRCNSREIIGTGVAGDYFYDGISGNQSEVSMAEAKGSILSSGGVLRTAWTAERGYTRQVEPHIGKRYPAGAAGVIQVVHGYCIAAGAIAGGSAAIGHVVETGAPAAAAASGGAGNGDPDGPTRASPAIVLRNYAAAISLSGGPTTGELLKDFAASGRFPRIWNEEFREIEFRGQPFMIGASPRANGGFALWRPIFDQLFFLLQGRLSLESDLVWQLPDQQLLRQNEDGGAVLPDGLAVLPPGYLDRQGMIFPLESNAAAAFDYANRMPMR